MNSTKYYIGTMDIWVEISKDKKLLYLKAPDLGWNIACPTAKVVAGTQKLNALVPAFKRRDGDGSAEFVVTEDLLDLMKAAQEDPKLFEKIVAVTEARIALKGGN